MDSLWNVDKTETSINLDEEIENQKEVLNEDDSSRQETKYKYSEENLPGYPYPLLTKDGYTICQLCGEKFISITNTHLEKIHDISFEDYKKRFPESPSVGPKKTELKEKRKAEQLDREVQEKLKEHLVEIPKEEEISSNKTETEEMVEKKKESDGEFDPQDYIKDILKEFDDELKKEYRSKNEDRVTEPVIDTDFDLSLMSSLDNDSKKDMKVITQEGKQKGFILKDKDRLLNNLKEIYPNIKKDLFIRKVAGSGKLVYEYISDFADPVLKINVEFVKAFWHNRNKYQDLNRNDILRKDGWKVVVINKPTVTRKELFSILKE